jgi:hypothetical protein
MAGTSPAMTSNKWLNRALITLPANPLRDPNGGRALNVCPDTC